MNINEVASTLSVSWLDEIQERSSNFVKLMTYYKCAMMEIETKFKVLDAEFSFQHDRNPISGVKCRLKSLGSIMEKLNRKQLPCTLAAMEQNINDIAGVRVCCSFIDDVYMLADSLLSQDDVTLIDCKDYIKHPKANGYRSLHLIVGIPIFLANEKHIMKVEIQLRTIAMDFWASLEHQLRYKKEADFTAEMANELLYCAEQSSNLDNRMNGLRNMLQ